MDIGRPIFGIVIGMGIRVSQPLWQAARMKHVADTREKLFNIIRTVLAIHKLFDTCSRAL